jgi:enterochelin esterase-like enzyme
MNHWIGILVLLITFSCKSQTSPLPKVKEGKLDFISSFPSLNVDPRPVAIWKSPLFDPNKKHILIILHDGQMLFDNEITWNHEEWHIDEHLSILEKKYPLFDFLVVGIYNNGAKRHSEYFPEKPFLQLPPAFQDSIYQHTKRNEHPLFATTIYSDRYLHFITSEIIPYVRKNYVETTVENTWIGGASMGGLISWYALNEYPEIFGKALCFSTHWPGIWPQDDPYLKVFRSFEDYQMSRSISSTSSYYFDHGDLTLDQYYAPYQNRIDSLLKLKGVLHHSLFYPQTDHSERSWSAHFSHAVELLLK